MKNLISIFLVFIFTSSIIVGQDSTQNSLKQGKFALQFQLEGSFAVKPFQESSFSGKYHLTDFSAIRAGIQISNSVDIENKIDGKDTSKPSSLDIRINAQYIFYLSVVDDICLFTGAGLSYGRDLNINDIYWLEQDRWNIGLSAIIGTEWFVKKNISISGEYSIRLDYEDSYYKDIEGGKIFTRHRKNIYLNNYNQFKIGISLYL